MSAGFLAAGSKYNIELVAGGSRTAALRADPKVVSVLAPSAALVVGIIVSRIAVKTLIQQYLVSGTYSSIIIM